jgi:hypothetical protein
MDMLLKVLGKRKRRRRGRLAGIDANGNAIWAEEKEEVGTTTLLAYVNMKGALIFCDLAVGVTIPVYTEVMRLNIGTRAPRAFFLRQLARAATFAATFAARLRPARARRHAFDGARDRQVAGHDRELRHWLRERQNGHALRPQAPVHRRGLLLRTPLHVVPCIAARRVEPCCRRRYAAASGRRGSVVGGSCCARARFELPPVRPGPHTPCSLGPAGAYTRSSLACSSPVLGCGHSHAPADLRGAPSLRAAQVCAVESAAAHANRSLCPMLKQCIEAAVEASELPGWQQRPAAHSHSHSGSAATQGLELAVWFLVFFTARHSLGHTLVAIPYDALGQELTTDSETRQVGGRWREMCPRLRRSSAAHAHARTRTHTHAHARARLTPSAARGARLRTVASARCVVCSNSSRGSPSPTFAA